MSKPLNGKQIRLWASDGSVERPRLQGVSFSNFAQVHELQVEGGRLTAAYARLRQPEMTCNGGTAFRTAGRTDRWRELTRTIFEDQQRELLIGKWTKEAL